MYARKHPPRWPYITSNTPKMCPHLISDSLYIYCVVCNQGGGEDSTFLASPFLYLGLCLRFLVTQLKTCRFEILRDVVWTRWENFDPVYRRKKGCSEEYFDSRRIRIGTGEGSTLRNFRSPIIKLTNSMVYGTRKFNSAFTRALQ